MTKNRNLIITHSLLFLLVLHISSCTKFVFLEIDQEKQQKELINHKIPHSSADLFEAPVVNESIPNPDADGAFNDWATCLIMVKEGHPHGGSTLHGNYVYENSPWKQEQFTIVHNTPNGIVVDVDKESTATDMEKKLGRKGPDYFRIIGGSTKLWGLCLYFFDKKGDLINDKILNSSERYQLFFSISDLDSKGQPYTILDTRYRGEENTVPIPALYFENKNSFEQRKDLTPEIFWYTYRDTWSHEQMGDGVRDLYNIRLIPPLTEKDMAQAKPFYDQDCVGLKGHLSFSFQDDPIDPLFNLNIKLSNGLTYNRVSSLQPQFYMAIKVMKCPLSTDKYIRQNPSGSLIKKGCSEFYNPDQGVKWEEVIRMNIKFKVYASTFDSNPTNPDPKEPYYYQLGKEIGLTPEEAFDAANNVIVHGNGGGLGFGAWFL